MRNLTKSEFSSVQKLKEYLLGECEHPLTQHWIYLLGEIEQEHLLGKRIKVSKQEFLASFDELIKMLEGKVLLYGGIKRASRYDIPEVRQEKEQWNTEFKQAQNNFGIARRLFNICSVTW